MMLSWNLQRMGLFSASALLAFVAPFSTSVLLDFLEPEEGLSGDLKRENVAAIRRNETSTAHRISNERLTKVGSTPLHRMMVPTPLPPVAPSVEPVLPLVAEEPFLQGILLGVIVDKDPRYNFAIIQFGLNRVSLIGQGQSLQEDGKGPILQTVRDDSVVLSHQGRTQTMNLRAQQ